MLGIAVQSLAILQMLPIDPDVTRAAHFRVSRKPGPVPRMISALLRHGKERPIDRETKIELHLSRHWLAGDYRHWTNVAYSGAGTVTCVTFRATETVPGEPDEPRVCNESTAQAWRNRHAT